MKTLSKEILEKTLEQLYKRFDELYYVARISDQDKEDRVLAERNMVEIRQCIKEIQIYLDNYHEN